MAYFLLFRYYPMLGLQIAFRKYKATLGIWGSPWVGLDNFTQFFSTPAFKRALPNTLAISVGTLIISLIRCKFLLWFSILLCCSATPVLVDGGTGVFYADDASPVLSII